MIKSQGIKLPDHGIDWLDECLSLSVEHVENETVETSSNQSKYWIKCPGQSHSMIRFPSFKV